jgi:four helix bundle protein
MNQLMKNPEEYKIWKKVLDLAETIQKSTKDLSPSGSDYVLSIVRKITFTIPSYLAEGFMMKNIKDRKDSLYRALHSLEEIIKSLQLTEEMGHFKKTNMNKIRIGIYELNSMIGELLIPQQKVRERGGLLNNMTTVRMSNNGMGEKMSVQDMADRKLLH